LSCPWLQIIKVFVSSFYYDVFLKNCLLLLVIDIRMDSPPNSLPPAHGSSRMTGGIFRGHAFGNTLNAADFDDVLDVLHPIPGKVLVYSSNQDPANLTVQDMKPTMFVRHDVTSSIRPVLAKVAEKYSPIQSELYLS
jgi:hypothetical protein